MNTLLAWLIIINVHYPSAINPIKFYKYINGDQLNIKVQSDIYEIMVFYIILMVYIGIKYQTFNTIWYLLIAKHFNNYYLINNYELMI